MSFCATYMYQSHKMIEKEEENIELNKDETDK